MVKGFNPMQQVKALQEKMAKMQEEMAQKTVESSACPGQRLGTVALPAGPSGFRCVRHVLRRDRPGGTLWGR